MRNGLPVERGQLIAVKLIAVKPRRQIAVALYAAVLGLLMASSLAATSAQGRDRDAETKPVTAPAISADLAGGSPNATKDRRVYVSIKEIMESIIDPSADVLWGAVGTIMDKEGVQELIPKTPEEWLDVRRAAVRIIEGGNLLMMPSR